MARTIDLLPRPSPIEPTLEQEIATLLASIEWRRQRIAALDSQLARVDRIEKALSIAIGIALGLTIVSLALNLGGWI